jgi:4-amino-4-deoxy-L-arabinose transferase-like glycosyltransferase
VIIYKDIDMKNIWLNLRSYFAKNEKRRILAILFCIIVIGATFRLYNLGKNPFIADEFLDMNSAYAFRMTNTWQAWDFNFGQVNSADINNARDVRAWGYKWQVAEVFRILAPTEQNARLVSVFWGLVSILLIYGVTASFTKKRSIGLLSAFLFAISAMGIMFDRKLRMYSMFYPAYMALSWLLFKFYEQKYEGKNKLVQLFQKYIGANIWYLAPLVVVGLVSLHLQLLTVNIVAAFFGYVLVQTIILIWQEKKLSWNKYSFATSAMLIFGAVAIKYFPQYTGIFVASIKFFINNSGYFDKILSDYNSPILAVIFLVLGAYYLYRNLGRKKETVWLLTSLLVPLLMAAFLWRRTQGIQYVFFIQSFLIILIATGIYGVGMFFEKHLAGNFAKKAFAVTIFLSLLLLPRYAYFFEDNTTYHRTDVGDYRKVIQYVKRNLQKNDVVITRNFRNYYFSGAHVKIFDFGGEAATQKFDETQLQQVIQQNSKGWIVLFDNDIDFMTEGARQYIEKNLKKVDNSFVRGQADVYYW